ncbi:MAG TPA: AraC family transcriptional regulator [Polyangiales bacterium]
MDYALYRPGPPLDRFVETLWAADHYVADAPRERVLPNGAHALVIHLAEHPLHIYASEQTYVPTPASGAIVCGARQTSLIIGTALGPTVGAQFRPGGASRIFRLPGSALLEQTVPLEALWGRCVGSLRERLLASDSTLARARLLEAQLLARLRDVSELDPALRISLNAFEERTLTSVAEVNRRTGLSPKRLLALFRDEVGLSPKAYWRVRRFRGALHDLDRGALRGAALACSHGYCDQAHFLREFRAISGASPSEYLASRNGGDHIALHG